MLPIRLRIGKRTYAINVVNAMKRKGLQGHVSYGTSLIELGLHSNRTGRRYTNDELLHTFWHEIVHAILYEMDHRLYSNERFVDEFSLLLTRAIKSAKF